jgi:type IV pilus assembly protein PilA
MNVNEHESGRVPFYVHPRSLTANQALHAAPRACVICIDMQTRRCGFSLIELLIVIAIMMIIAAIAIPHVNEQMMLSREVAATEQIKTIHAVETQYYAQFGRYAQDLSELSTAGLIPKSLASGKKSGYKFVAQATPVGYTVAASPAVFGGTGRRTFYSDQTLVIRQNWGREPATGESSELP